MASQFTAFLAPSDYYKIAESTKRNKRDFISQQQKEQRDQIKRELVMMKRQAKTVNQLLGEDIHKKNKLELNKLNWYYKKSFAKNKNEKYLEFQGVMHKLISNIKNSEKDLKEIKKKNDSFRVEDIKSFTISEINSKGRDRQKKGIHIKSLRDINSSSMKQFKNSNKKMTLSQLPLFNQDFETNEDINNDEDDDNQDNDQGTDDFIIESQTTSRNFDRKLNQKYSRTLNVIKSSEMGKQMESTDRQVDFAKFNKIINNMQKLCKEIIPDIKKLAKTKKMQDKQFKTDKIRLIEVLKSPNYANQKQNMKLISNEKEELHPYLKFLGYDNIEQIPNLSKRPRMEIVESRYLYNQFLQIEKKSFQQIKNEQTIKERNSISSNFERQSKKSLKRSSQIAVDLSHNNHSLPQYSTARKSQQLNTNDQEKSPNSQRSRHSNFRNTEENNNYNHKQNSITHDHSFIREKATSSSYFQRRTTNSSPKKSINQFQRRNSHSSFTKKVQSEKSSPVIDQLEESKNIRRGRLSNSPIKTRQNSINSPLPNKQSLQNSPELKTNSFTKYPQHIKQDLPELELQKRKSSRHSNSRSIDFQQQFTNDRTNLGYQSVSDRIKKRALDQKLNQYEENASSPKMLQKNIFIRNSLDLSVQIQKKFNVSQQSYMTNSNRKYSNNQQEESIDKSREISYKKNSQHLFEGFSNYFNKYENSNHQDQILELDQSQPDFHSSPKQQRFERKVSGGHQIKDDRLEIQRRKSSNVQATQSKVGSPNYRKTDIVQMTQNRTSIKQKTENSETPSNSTKNFNKKQISFTNNNSYKQNIPDEQNQSSDKLNTFNRTFHQSRFSSTVDKKSQNLNETKSSRELSVFSGNPKMNLKHSFNQTGKESDQSIFKNFHHKSQQNNKNDVSFIANKKPGIHVKTEESHQSLHQQNNHHTYQSHSNRNIQIPHKDKNEKQNHEVADIFNTMTLQDLNIMRRQVEQLRGKNNEIFNNIANAAHEGDNKFQKGYQQIKREMLTYKEEKDNIVDTWEKKQLLLKQKNRKQIKEIIKNHYEEQERVEKELNQQNQDQIDQLIGTNYYYSSINKKQQKQRPSKNLTQKLTYEQLKLKNMKLIQQAKNMAASKKLIEDSPVANNSVKPFQSSFSQKLQEQIKQIEHKGQYESQEDHSKSKVSEDNNKNQPKNLISILANQSGRRSILQNKTNNSSNNINQKLSIITGADNSLNKNNVSMNEQFSRNNYSSVINLPNLTSINSASIEQIMSITDRNILNKTDQIEESKQFIKEINNSSLTDSFLIKQMEEFIQCNKDTIQNQSKIEKEDELNNKSQLSNKNNQSHHDTADNNKTQTHNKSTVNMKDSIFDNQDTKNSEKRNVSLKLLKEKQQQKHQIKEYLSQVLTRFNRTHSNQSDEIMKQIRKYRKHREKNQIDVDFDQMNHELQKKQNEFLLMMSAQTEEMKKKKKIEDILWQTQQRIYSNKKFDPTKFYRDEISWQNTINEATEYQEGLEGHIQKVKNTLSKAQRQGSPASKLLPMTPAQSFIQQAKKKIGFKQQ